MSKIKWDEVGKRTYETGNDHGVLYPQSNDGTYPLGVAWNGLTGIDESPDGAEQEPLWADNIKYLNLTSAEEFGLTITAYTYPDEWAACDGSLEVTTGVIAGQQSRKSFGFCYRSVIGNDILGNDYGYKLHLVYGCRATPSERSYETINDSPEAIEFSWEIDTTPVAITEVPNAKPTSVLTIDSTKVDPDKLNDLIDILYGTDADATAGVEATDPRLPLPDEVISTLR